MQEILSRFPDAGGMMDGALASADAIHGEETWKQAAVSTGAESMSVAAWLT